MSIIAVTGFPQKFTIKEVMKQLARPIYGNFEALNFVGANKAKNKDGGTKTCYLRLSKKLDPVRVVQKINDFTFRTKRQYKAHIPDKIPDVSEIGTSVPTKTEPEQGTLAQVIIELTPATLKTVLEAAEKIRQAEIVCDWGLVHQSVNMEINATHVHTLSSTQIVSTKNTLSNSLEPVESHLLATEPQVCKKRRRRKRGRGGRNSTKEECVPLQEQTSMVTGLATISTQMKPDSILSQTKPSQESLVVKQVMKKPTQDKREAVPKTAEKERQEEEILPEMCSLLKQPVSMETRASSQTVPPGQVELTSGKVSTEPEIQKKRKRRKPRLAQRLRMEAEMRMSMSSFSKTAEEECVLEEQTSMVTKKNKWQRQKDTFQKWYSILQQPTLDTSANIPSVSTATVSIDGTLDNSQGPGEELVLQKPKIESKKVQLRDAAVHKKSKDPLAPEVWIQEDQDLKILSAIKNRQKAVTQDDSTIPLGTKPKALPKKIRNALCIPEDQSYDQILNCTTEEIVTEMQAKYPGLLNVSKKTGHKLMQEIGKKIYIRAKELADSNEEASQSCFTLSRAYRRIHPHFGDFQLILSTLHTLQDAVGVPRTQLQEADISSLPPGPPTLNLTPDKIKSMCSRNTQYIVNQMKAHIDSVQSEILATDSEEELARKQVRSELKKFSPYLYMIVDQVLRKHFLPADGPYCRLRIYGEPFLPSKDIMSSFLNKFKPVHVIRSTRMYNLLKFNVPPAQYQVLMAMNGTVLSGAKLIIRSSDIAHYVYRLNRDNSGEEEMDQMEDIPMDQDQLENWDEDEVN